MEGCRVLLAAVLPSRLLPLSADAGAFDSRACTRRGGAQPAVGRVSPDVQFDAGGRTGTRTTRERRRPVLVGFSSTRTHGDTASGTLVTVALYGAPGGGVRRSSDVDSSRSGARVEATVDVRRVTMYRPHCGRSAIATPIVEDLGPATLVAEFEVTGHGSAASRASATLTSSGDVARPPDDFLRGGFVDGVGPFERRIGVDERYASSASATRSWARLIAAHRRSASEAERLPRDCRIEH